MNPCRHPKRPSFSTACAIGDPQSPGKKACPRTSCATTPPCAIAQAAPTTSAALESVKGMGPFKVKMYGKAILATVRGGE